MLTTILFGLLIWTFVSIPAAILVGKCFALSSMPDERKRKPVEQTATYRARLSTEQMS